MARYVESCTPDIRSSIPGSCGGAAVGEAPTGARSRNIAWGLKELVEKQGIVSYLPNPSRVKIRGKHAEILHL